MSGIEPPFSSWPKWAQVAAGLVMPAAMLALILWVLQ
jgi:hypothetical protein